MCGRHDMAMVGFQVTLVWSDCGMTVLRSQVLNAKCKMQKPEIKISCSGRRLQHTQFVHDFFAQKRGPLVIIITMDCNYAGLGAIPRLSLPH